MPEKTDKNRLKVILLRHTPEPLATVALAARLCYRETDISELAASTDAALHIDLVRNVVARGHESVLEHVSFSFAVGGLSRAASHQLVRHRLASYSQQSQRYVRFDNLEGVIPPAITADANALKEFQDAWEVTKRCYDRLLEMGIGAEDARYILPNATTTQIMITMNVRELRHFFRMRLCRRAQWEIRTLAGMMLRDCRNVSPELFGDVGPNCLNGTCREGDASCGKPWRKDRELEDQAEG